MKIDKKSLAVKEAKVYHGYDVFQELPVPEEALKEFIEKNKDKVLENPDAAWIAFYESWKYHNANKSLRQEQITINGKQYIYEV